MGPPVKGQVSEAEAQLIHACTKGNMEEVKQLLQEPGVRIDCLDETGMTPLQHAAFRGKRDLCELLLANGADVNSNYHENGYTALMFAALSGNPGVTKLMLEKGGKKDHVNSVGRNAAQMAAFVGQHPCVAVINNFFDRQDIEYYTVVRGQETEPKLPPTLVMSMTQLMNMSNMHPVKVSMFLQGNYTLMDDSVKVCRVLDLICEKAMKEKDTQDVVAVKASYFATIIRHAKKMYNAETKSLDTWIKRLLKGREKDGHPEMQDNIIRQALKDFPYAESQLFQTMVRQLSEVKIGDHPTSLNILMQAVNGQKFGRDEEEDCSTCGEPDAKRKCSACKMAFYCNQTCQRAHWFTHKKFCKSLAVQYEKMTRERERLKRLEEKEQQEEARLQEDMKKVSVSGAEKTEGGAAENGTESGDSNPAPPATECQEEVTQAEPGTKDNS